MSELFGNNSVVNVVVAEVKKLMANNDGSHDWFHVERVCKNAINIAHKEGLISASIGDDTEEQLNTRHIILLAALLHDAKDWKYSQNASSDENTSFCFELLSSQGYNQDNIHKISYIISNMSYHSRLSSAISENLPETVDSHTLKCLDVIIDADQLDAIGAIGIGRCFSYGGHRGMALYDPDIKPNLSMTKEDYKKQNIMVKNNMKVTSSLNHFHEKLFKIKGLMRTETGRKLAEKRHTVLQEFVETFMAEWDGNQ